MPRFEDKAFAPTQWTVVDSKANATATATQAAVTGKQHFVTGFSFSASAAVTTAATLEVRDGATVLDRIQIPVSSASAPLQAIVHSFVPPLTLTAGNAATVTVGALGSGVTGTVVLKGKTFNEP